MNFRTIRQVPIDMLGNVTAYMAQHPIQTGLAGAALGGAGASMAFPSATASPQNILNATEMDKEYLLDELARSGKFNSQEIYGLSLLNKDEIIQYLSQDNNGLNLEGALLGAGAAGLAVPFATRGIAQNLVMMPEPSNLNRYTARPV